MPKNGFFFGGQIFSGKDLNDYIITGYYNVTTKGFEGVANAPTGVHGYGILEVINVGTVGGERLLQRYTSDAQPVKILTRAAYVLSGRWIWGEWTNY